MLWLWTYVLLYLQWIQWNSVYYCTMARLGIRNYKYEVVYLVLCHCFQVLCVRRGLTGLEFHTCSHLLKKYILCICALKMILAKIQVHTRHFLNCNTHVWCFCRGFWIQPNYNIYIYCMSIYTVHTYIQYMYQASTIT